MLVSYNNPSTISFSRIVIKCTEWVKQLYKVFDLYLLKSLKKEELPDYKIKESKDPLSQREFMNAIIHELKTPLSAISGFSEILQIDIRNPESVEECADSIKEINEAASDLNDLIHDLLDVGSDTDPRNFSIDLSREIDICLLVKRSIRLNKGYSITRGINITSESSNQIKSIKLDPKRIKQILTNLISNSIKYSPKGSEIKVFTHIIKENNADYLEIMVTDQGFGMTKSQIEVAFQKYQTIQNPNSGTVDSFGMGLPIVKQLVELQNGSIKVESEVSKGTCIFIKFPYEI